MTKYYFVTLYGNLYGNRFKDCIFVKGTTDESKGLFLWKNKIYNSRVLDSVNIIGEYVDEDTLRDIITGEIIKRKDKYNCYDMRSEEQYLLYNSKQEIDTKYIADMIKRCFDNEYGKENILRYVEAMNRVKESVKEECLKTIKHNSDKEEESKSSEEYIRRFINNLR